MQNGTQLLFFCLFDSNFGQISFLNNFEDFLGLCAQFPLIKSASETLKAVLFQIFDYLNTQAPLQSHLQRVRLVCHALISDSCILSEPLETSLERVEFSKAIGGQNFVDLIFDLGEHELVLRHHVKCFCLQDLLLVVLKDAFFSHQRPLVLLVKLQSILAHLVIMNFHFGNLLL